MHCWSQQNELRIKRVVNGASVVTHLGNNTARVEQVCLQVAAFSQFNTNKNTKMVGSLA